MMMVKLPAVSWLRMKTNRGLLGSSRNIVIFSLLSLFFSAASQYSLLVAAFQQQLHPIGKGSRAPQYGKHLEQGHESYFLKVTAFDMDDNVSSSMASPLPPLAPRNNNNMNVKKRRIKKRKHRSTDSSTTLAGNANFKFVSKKQQQRNGNQEKNTTWNGGSIPERIPSLSEVLQSSSTSVEAAVTLAKGTNGPSAATTFVDEENTLDKSAMKENKPAKHSNGTTKPAEQVTNDNLDASPSTEKDKMTQTNRMQGEKHRISSKQSPPKHEKQSKHVAKTRQHTQRDYNKISNASKKPWSAGYYTSLKSQKRIQTAAADTSKTNKERATAVLETFLSIPPEKCNPANLVCALTLSAKVMQENGGRSYTEYFRSLLFRTTDILQQLLQDKQLSARQLCNVVWAIAKHYDRDNELLPSAPEQTALESNAIGQAETWDLRVDLAGCPARRVDETVDEIAIQLSDLLTTDLRAAKEGELCMASWAYGILRRRRRPAGWQTGPQLGKIRKTHNEEDDEVESETPYVSSGDFIKFEQWETASTRNNNKKNNDLLEEKPAVNTRMPTEILMDKIGEALCEPKDPTVVITKADPTTWNEHELCLSSCRWSELANVAWAFASHGHAQSQESEQLLTAIAQEGSRRLHENGVQAKSVLSRDIAQIIWSLGTLQADNFRLADSLIEFVDAVSHYTKVDTVHSISNRPFQSWSCADLVQVILSLAHARYDEMSLLRSLYGEALRRLEMSENKNIVTQVYSSGRLSFLPWEISVLLWAQARLYLQFPEEGIFNAFAATAVSKVNTAVKAASSFREVGLGAQEQANIAWSVTVLELYNGESFELLKSIFDEAASSCEEQGVIQLEHAHQLWQALFLLEEEHRDYVKDVPNWFRLYLEDKWSFEKARPKISSARHKSLSKTLNLMGVPHFNEHDEDIDVAIVLKPKAVWTHETKQYSTTIISADGETKGVKVAVEFDGPNHFTRQRIPEDGSKPKPPRALGHTVLKYRLLKKQGWTVVRVPYYEYDKIPFWASMERQRYLQRLLKTHGNLQFSTVDVSEYKPQLPVRRSRFD